VTTLDFSVLTLMAPFWVLNDAEYRKWNKGGMLQYVLPFLPLIGPIVYLNIRPKLPTTIGAETQ